jgi:hypothetical protein
VTIFKPFSSHKIYKTRYHHDNLHPFTETFNKWPLNTRWEKKRTFYNTDGIVKCLLQPGHIRYQLHKSMLATSFHLLNFVYPDSSCCRDKVSRAAGRRSVGSVFCSPFIKCTVTSKWRFHYRDSYAIGFYCDKTTSRHLPGLAKNSPTPTQTAPNHTTEPLCLNLNTLRNLSPMTEKV